MSSKIGALATPLKSPCDQRERGRERAYEQSECASGVSVARATNGSVGKATSRRKPRWSENERGGSRASGATK